MRVVFAPWIAGCPFCVVTILYSLNFIFFIFVFVPFFFPPFICKELKSSTKHLLQPTILNLNLPSKILQWLLNVDFFFFCRYQTNETENQKCWGFFVKRQMKQTIRNDDFFVVVIRQLKQTIRNADFFCSNQTNETIRNSDFFLPSSDKCNRQSEMLIFLLLRDK